MSYLSISGIVIFISSLICSGLIFFANPKTTLKTTWGLFSFAVSLWGLGLFKAYTTTDYISALFWLRFLNLSALTIPVFFIHFVFLFTKKLQKKWRELTIYYSLMGIIFSIAIFFPEEFIPNLSPKSGYQFYPNSGTIYYVFFAIFCYLASYGSYLLYLETKNINKIKSYQAKYILFGVAVGFLGGSTTFLEVFDLKIYPFGTSLVTLYVVLTTYAIIKYRLMDIKLAFTRAGIFIFVYSLVLGIPFYFGYSLGAWRLALSAMLVFATIGPFIYLFIQRRAEEALLQEQRQYQNTLRQASLGMARIKDLNKLLNLMVHILSRTVRIEHCAIYLLDAARGNYTLKASRGFEGGNRKVPQELDENSDLIKLLKENQEIIVCEEIEQQAVDTGDGNLAKTISTVHQLETELVVPSLDGENLIAVLVLGKKKSGEMYSSDDLLVFSILANQSAIGIENALFYEETGKGLTEKFHDKRLKSLGELGSGVAHQINNRFNVVSVAAGVGLSLINKQDITKLSQEDLVRLVLSLKEILEKIEKAALKGKETAEAIKTYSKASVVPSAVTIGQGISSSLALMDCKFKIERLNLKEEYDPDVYVWINLSLLQEVFSNAIDNSHDAMTTKEKMVKGQRLNIREYKPQFIIRTYPKKDRLFIEIIDNGIGMTPEQLDKIFIPFFTTKGASKGTGMGMNMMKQLLEKNNGTIDVKSKYGEGATVIISLLLATQEQINATREETQENDE